MLAYVAHFGQPPTAVLPHLALILAWSLGFSALRLIFCAISPGRAIQVVLVIFAGSVWLLQLLYYSLVSIGLANWGRVVTWPMLTPYFAYWRELLATLGIPLGLVVSVSIVAVIATLVFSAWCFKRRAWLQLANEKLSAGVRATLVTASLLIFALSVHRLTSGIYLASGEPLSQSLNPAYVSEALTAQERQWRDQIDMKAKVESSQYVADTVQTKRNVILIVGDALRPSRMSLFGYVRPTTPNLERLSRDGRIVYAESILSACAETVCGLTAMATSKYLFEGSQFSLTLSHVLASHGYRTGFILGGEHGIFGLSQRRLKADFFWDGSQATGYINDDRAVVERAKQLPSWDGRPTMLQFHLMSAHALGKRADAFIRYRPMLNYYGLTLSVPNDDQKVGVNNYYDNGVTQFDAMVGDLLEILGQRGYLQETVVVITGDHGEMLGEHGMYSHGKSLFQTALEVPLIVMRYGYSGSTQHGKFASQVDVAPTIVEEVGLKVPQSWSGRPLSNLTPRDFLFFQQKTDVGLLDLRDPENPRKFWSNKDTGAERVFNVLKDPQEERNLVVSTGAERLAEWRTLLTPALNSHAQR